MRKYTVHCDLCGVEVDKNINGFCIEAGYSIGGWGSRRDYIKFSGEICDVCFTKVNKEAKKFAQTINKLKK